jgi:holo-ACP synthase / triphosphoribosyl-dephospho-CoA synthase
MWSVKLTKIENRSHKEPQAQDAGGSFKEGAKMKPEEVTLGDVLAARETRAEAQQNLIKQYGKPVVSFSMNIAGEIKTTPLIEMAFRHACGQIEKEITSDLIYKSVIFEKTGPEALYVFDQDAETIKDATMKIENGSPLGRLFDIDVIRTSGEKISRNKARQCLVCGGPVTLCSRSRAHGLDAVKAATQNLLLDFAAEKLAGQAVDALLEEAKLSPKPGLVDSLNNGSHKDMNLDMLCRSAAVLKPYFADCVRLGAESDNCIHALQCAGLCAEKTMLQETGGINTHKGAIFALGIYLGALGGYLHRGGDLFDRCSGLVREKMSIPSSSGQTHGEWVRDKYKSGGATEEALNGFPTARKGAAALVESGGDACRALLKIMEEIDDTNLLYRGGKDALDYVHNESKRILGLNEDERKKALLAMDKECIKRNISPGGAADMLALAILISKTT